MNKFWAWYERRYSYIAPATAILFLLQLVHLYWLSTDVVFLRLHGHELWDVGGIWDIIISLIDYTEIPAIVSASIFYIYQWRRDKSLRFSSIVFLLLINSQWLHLFWITDEIIYSQFTGEVTILIPIWLSWIAISIDYLELPVMYDTIKKAILSLRKTS